jgi:hypothetical protein
VACDTTDTTASFPETLPEFHVAGRAWTYAYTLERRSEDATLDTTLTRTIQVRVTDPDASVGARTGLAEVETLVQGNPSTISRTWYVQTPDSLVDVAYQNPGAAPIGHLRRANVPITARSLMQVPIVDGLPSRIIGRHATSDTDTSIVERDDPRVVLRAPLTEGQSWTAFREPFFRERLVIGEERVATDAGPFDAAVIESTIPELAPDLRMTDFVAREGLARRVITDTAEVRAPSGEPAGKAVFRETFELTVFRGPS